ncbi:DUF4867 family protein [Caloramator sp. mosi_1]|uniref:DUF4867 family protein n=1 Tax=Caloramator sp. mosi_1 TaxID=3023090 RepID=UPI00236010A6|nr:DUF4867 family protein [Caloramator sp. mosi_1]WDC85304.1 DUF4867 family protein [Caloramator sp. mosi_1]
MLTELNKKNDFTIYSIFDEEFKMYGRVLQGYDFSEVIRYMEEKPLYQVRVIYMLPPVKRWKR